MQNCPGKTPGHRSDDSLMAPCLLSVFPLQFLWQDAKKNPAQRGKILKDDYKKWNEMNL